MVVFENWAVVGLRIGHLRCVGSLVTSLCKDLYDLDFAREIETVEVGEEAD